MAILIPFGDTWKYDYGRPLNYGAGFESPTFDDSAWRSGRLPAGKSGCGLNNHRTYWDAPGAGAGNPNYNTFIMRYVLAGSLTNIVAKWYVDDNVTIWIDGVAVHNAAGVGGSDGTNLQTASLPDFTGAWHVIAVRARDNNGNCAYIDFQLEGDQGPSGGWRIGEITMA